MIVDAIRRIRAPAQVEARADWDSPSWWRKTMLVGGPTIAGPSVNEYTALAHGTVYACVRLLSETIANQPLRLKRRDGKDVFPAEDHPLARVLGRQANRRQVAFQAMQFLAASLLLRGNGLAIVQRNGGGDVVAYWPIRWDHIRPEIEGGDVVFVWNPATGGQRVLRRGDYWHVHTLSTDGVVGLSPIALQREGVGYGLALQEYGARLFGNGASPSGVITHPERLGGGKEEEADGVVRRLREQIEGLYSGLENSHRIAILEEGMKWERMGIAPDDAQFLQSRQFNAREIAAWFGIPSHLVGDEQKGEFSIETRSGEFATIGVQPKLTLIEQTIARDLLSDAEQDTFFAQFDTQELKRGATEAETAADVNGIQWGYLTRNEVRARRGLNPLPGLDEPLVPLNMAPAGAETDRGASSVPDPGRSVPPPERPVRLRMVEGRSAESRARLASFFRQPLEDLVSRLVAAEARELHKLAERTLAPAGEARSAGGRGQDIETFLAGHEQLHDPAGEFRALVLRRSRPIVANFARAMIDQAATELGREAERSGLEEWIDGSVGAFAARYAIASLRSVDAAVTAAPDAPAAAVEALLGLWKEERPGRAAAKETVHQSRAATREAFRRSGVTLIKWRARGDGCPMCARLDGRVVAIEGGNFVSDGEEFQAEGRPPLTPRTSIGHPPLHRGCDCEIEAVTT